MNSNETKGQGARGGGAMDALLLYHALGSDPVFASVKALLAAFAEGSGHSGGLAGLMRLTHGALRALLGEAAGLAWSDYVIYRLLSADNPFVRFAAQSEAERASQPARALWLKEAAAHDLAILQGLAAFSFPRLLSELERRAIAEDCSPVLAQLKNLPHWPERLDAAAIAARCAENEAAAQLWERLWACRAEAGAWPRLLPALSVFHGSHAFAPLCFHSSFRYARGSAALRPVPGPEKDLLPAFHDYGGCLARLSRNTADFLDGRQAENALLYGPRGTGKSSAVRLMLEAFAARGLKLLELKQDELDCLPELFRLLAELPAPFILFIDDLSFERMDEAYTRFKNAVEGSVLAPPPNVLLYVTSNRRHLVSEQFSDTEDALYKNDVRSERLSLAERFGLRLRFVTPGRSDYLKLIRRGLEAGGARYTEEEWAAIEAAALRDATTEASLSPRNAQKFMRRLLAKGVEHV